MKRAGYYIIMLQLTILLMVGCSTKSIAVDDDRPYRVVQTLGYTERLVNADRVYAFLFEPGEQFFIGGGILKYKEKNSGGWQTLCWKPSCSHTSEDCPAYYEYSHRLLNLGDKGEIRILEFTRPDGLAVWEINPNRSTKTKLASFDLAEMTDSTNNMLFMDYDTCEYGHKLYLFYETSSGSGDEWEIANWILCFDLETLKAEEPLCLQEIGLPEVFPFVYHFQLIEDGVLYCCLANQNKYEYNGDEGIRLRIYRFSLADHTWTDTGYETDWLAQNQMGHLMIEKRKVEDRYYLTSVDLLTGETSVITEVPGTITYTLSASQYLHRISILDTADASMYEYDMDTGETYNYRESYCVAYGNGYCAFDTYTLDGSGILRIEKVSP